MLFHFQHPAKLRLGAISRRILSSPPVLPVTNKTRLTNLYEKRSECFNKLPRNVSKLKNQVNMQQLYQAKCVAGVLFAFRPSVFTAAQIMHESDCLSADL